MNKLLLLLLFVVGTAGADNLISIDQVSSGNNNSTTVTVEGSDNEVDYSFGGASNSVSIDQKGDDAYVGYTTAWGSGAAWGGDLDGDSNNLNIKQFCNQSPCGGDRFEFHIQGDSNDIDFYQGYRAFSDGTLDTTDDYEYGGHYVRLDIHGSSNKFLGSQRSNNSGHEHSNTTNVYGSNNDVFAVQIGNQDKTLNLTLNNSYNDVDLTQKGSAAHSATISLSGSYGTDLDLLQQGGTAQTYSLTQSCVTVGGCSVGVTQGQ